MARRRSARTSLLGFAEYTMPAYQPAHLHRLICEKLEAVERGECRRLMIATPPRHGKSELVSRRFPAWFLGRNPRGQIISASYGQDLASDFGRDVRNIVGSKEFAALFPGVGLAADSAAKNRWHTNSGGSYVAAGVGTAITGRGADCLLGDTIISTDQGDIPIGSVVSGAPPCCVLSYDNDSESLVYRPITAALRREAVSFYRVHTAAGRVVEATGDHRFFTRSGYVEARFLAKGDVLLCAVRHGKVHTEADAVALVERVCEPAEVFDITVEGTHCFFANGVLVHNCLNIDDPVKDRAEAESEVTRKAVWDWYTSTAYTRLMPGGSVVLTMTRWHEDDLAGRLLEEAKSTGDQWEVLNLPALARAANDPLGRALDEPLWPEKYGADALARIRGTIGERDFGALYQQDPQPPGVSFFDVQNALVDGAPVPTPRLCDAVFATLDTAVKTGRSADGTAVCYWASSSHFGTPLVLLDWEILQIEGSLLETWLPTVFQRLESLAGECKARYGSLGAYIEDKASGTILLQQAARRGWPAQAIDSKLTAVGKDERAISVSGYIHAGMVKIAAPAYDKIATHKGRTGNHLLMQVFRFQLGVKDQMDDLLDCWCYGIVIALGNNEGY